MSEFVQIPLDFPKVVAYGVENFYVSSSNEQAFELINLLPDWTTFAAVIYGESGSGKTHLVKFAQEKEPNNQIINATNLDLLYQAKHKLIIVENIENVNQEALFHLFNQQKNKGLLLLTSKLPINRLNLSLKDLESRLLTVPEIEIYPPDDALIFGVLLKQFSDLQLDVSNDGLQYIFKNLERSFFAIHTLVAKIDFLSRSQKRKITIPLIKEAFASN